jgi:hypothetical protein
LEHLSAINGSVRTDRHDDHDQDSNHEHPDHDLDLDHRAIELDPAGWHPPPTQYVRYRIAYSATYATPEVFLDVEDETGRSLGATAMERVVAFPRPIPQERSIRIIEKEDLPVDLDSDLDRHRLHPHPHRERESMFRLHPCHTATVVGLMLATVADELTGGEKAPPPLWCAWRAWASVYLPPLGLTLPPLFAGAMEKIDEWICSYE